MNRRKRKICEKWGARRLGCSQSFAFDEGIRHDAIMKTIRVRGVVGNEGDGGAAGTSASALRRAGTQGSQGAAGLQALVRV
jgi:hypothetical protein